MNKFYSGDNIQQKRNFFKIEGYNIDKLTYEWFIKARIKNIIKNNDFKAKLPGLINNYNSRDVYNTDAQWGKSIKSWPKIKF